MKVGVPSNLITEHDNLDFASMFVCGAICDVCLCVCVCVCVYVTCVRRCVCVCVLRCLKRVHKCLCVSMVL